MLEQADHYISLLPSPPSSEPVMEILKPIGLFVRSVEQVVDDIPDENGLIQALREPQEFKKKIRPTALDFRLLERPDNVHAMPILPEPRFFSNEKQESE